MTRLAPRIKRHRDGMATLSGVPHSDLLSILTAASIHHYDTEKKHDGEATEVEAKARAYEEGPENLYFLGAVVRENYADNGAWMRRIRKTLDLLQPRHRYRHRYEDMSVSQLNDLGRWCRFRAVRQEREDRLTIERIMASFRKGAA